MAQLDISAQRARCAVVIPAHNEEKNIRATVETASRSELAQRVYVVDGASTDRTAELAEAAGACVIPQPARDGPAKGEAIQLAVDAVDADVLVFFDADLRGTRPEMIDDLARPILEDAADHVVATYSRQAGRVTELTAKPLFQMFFPEIRVRQPLAGEFALRRDRLRAMALEPDWGVESGMLIDSCMQDHRIVEVDLGHKEHDMKDLADLQVMARQVAATIIHRAILYGRFPATAQLSSEAPHVDPVLV